jgi:hypothetical protein
VSNIPNEPLGALMPLGQRRKPLPPLATEPETQGVSWRGAYFAEVRTGTGLVYELKDELDAMNPATAQIVQVQVPSNPQWLMDYADTLVAQGIVPFFQIGEVIIEGDGHQWTIAYLR